jgi:hypothetical protein
MESWRGRFALTFFFLRNNLSLGRFIKEARMTLFFKIIIACVLFWSFLLIRKVVESSIEIKRRQLNLEERKTELRKREIELEQTKLKK